MALSGLVLVGFVMGHMLGNLQVYPLFGGEEAFNAYAYKLHSLPYNLLWVVRAFLLACLVVHVWVAILLVLENRKARPENYRAQDYVQAKYSTRTMRWTGPILLAFIIYHLLHFTIRVGPGAEYGDSELHPDVPLLKNGHQVVDYVDESTGTIVYKTTHDAYGMVIAGFSKWPVALFYIIAMGLLCMHLVHGVTSMFQSLGLRNKQWTGRLGLISVAYGWIVFLGFISIPISVLTGFIS
jgi:succinate dehydrogenase / fumarate reductase cytochrome b subunit